MLVFKVAKSLFLEVANKIIEVKKIKNLERAKKRGGATEILA